ncbi:FMN reductase [Pontibacillus halophilus JSM 076056 = DSM 19796]|uniref:FMN reductase n=1 Tax=Pontibacillus halophilus JSM 076056 = DSM 19796 TaxID=1385510 RepID=A0A0A5GMG8_9BACI|nr:flavodoxin family protein [Pontibacillus halophilus]KGX92360.1 FMN reductase [Pontibacillus halophilus JSM 076056 = DSM 19796]
MKIAFVLGSSRQNGNSEWLGHQVLEGLDYTMIRLTDYNIHPITDQRHDQAGFQPVEDDYENVLNLFLQHDVIVFASPSYWFGMSAQLKAFFDRWSQYLRDPRYDLKAELSQKEAYVLITGGSNPKITALPLVQQFHYIFDFVGMKMSGSLIGHAVKPGEIQDDTEAIAVAKQWNHQLKQKGNA